MGQRAALIEQSTEVMDQIWKLVMARDLDALVEHVADDIIEAVLQTHSEGGIKRHVSFEDLVGLSNRLEQFQMDSYSERHVYRGAPKHATRLSSLLVNPQLCKHRYALESPSGERCVLTVTLALQEALLPVYRGVPRVSQLWRLVALTGEPETDEPATSPSRDLPPEAVVQAQLAALKANDIATVFAFAAPANRAVTGPLERFERIISSPMYRALLGHQMATPFRRVMGSADIYYEIVVLVSANTGIESRGMRAMYLWEVSRQGPDSGEEGCWMTNSVQLVSASVMEWPPS